MYSFVHKSQVEYAKLQVLQSDKPSMFFLVHDISNNQTQVSGVGPLTAWFESPRHLNIFKFQFPQIS